MRKSVGRRQDAGGRTQANTAGLPFPAVCILPPAACRLPPAGRSGGRAGFTLLEVMAAVMILAIGALLVLEQRNGAIRKAQGIAENRQASLALKAKLGEIELEKTRTTGQTGGDFQEPEFLGLTWRADISEEEWDFSDPDLGQLPPVKVHKVALTVAPVEGDEGVGWGVVTYLPLPGKNAGQNPSNQ